jgi:Na+-translocating ferredoxin:NAD+ oxidoreductase RnfD subunit
MATDYVTTPITTKGQILFALVIGLLTALFRTLGSTAEGVSYSIIIGNLLVPLIEKITVPHQFGCSEIMKFRGGKKNG